MIIHKDPSVDYEEMPNNYNDHGAEKAAIRENAMAVVETLREARKLIEKPENWCQGAIAMSGDKPVSSADKNADKWCATGAVSAASWSSPEPAEHRCLCIDALKRAQDDRMCPYSIEEWNDLPSTTHDEVLALIDSAIRHEENIEVFRFALGEANGPILDAKP